MLTNTTAKHDWSKTEEYRQMVSILNDPPVSDRASGIEVELTFINALGEYQHKLIRWGKTGKENFRESQEYARVMECIDFYWISCPDEIRTTLMVSVITGGRKVSQRMVDWIAPGISRS